MAKSKTKDLRELYGNLLGEDLVQKLSDDQVNLLSEYYNSLTKEEKDKINDAISEGKSHDLLEVAQTLLEESKQKPKAKTKKTRSKKKKTPEQDPPGALIKYEGVDEEDFVTEEIDERVLEILGLPDGVGLTYGEYFTLLREKLVIARGVESEASTVSREENEIIKNAFDEIRDKIRKGKDKSDTFKVKSKKISADKFFDKEKSTTLNQSADKSNQKYLLGNVTYINPKKIVSEEKFSDTNSLLEYVIEIRTSVNNILSLLSKQNDLQEKQSEKQRLDRSRRSKRKKEDKLEEIKTAGKNAIKSVIAPVQSILDRIINFFVWVIFGRAVVKFLEWIRDPKNKEKVEALGNLLKTWWPAILGAFVLFTTPLGKFIRVIVGTVTKLTFQLLRKGIPALKRFLSERDKRRNRITDDSQRKTRRRGGNSRVTEGVGDRQKPGRPSRTTPGRTPRVRGRGGLIGTLGFLGLEMATPFLSEKVGDLYSNLKIGDRGLSDDDLLKEYQKEKEKIERRSSGPLGDLIQERTDYSRLEGLEQELNKRGIPYRNGGQIYSRYAGGGSINLGGAQAFSGVVTKNDGERVTGAGRDTQAFDIAGGGKAVLQPGELVLNEQQQKNIERDTGIDPKSYVADARPQQTAGIRKYNTGGIIGGSLQKLYNKPKIDRKKNYSQDPEVDDPKLLDKPKMMDYSSTKGLQGGGFLSWWPFGGKKDPSKKAVGTLQNAAQSGNLGGVTQKLDSRRRATEDAMKMLNGYEGGGSIGMQGGGILGGLKNFVGNLFTPKKAKATSSKPKTSFKPSWYGPAPLPDHKSIEAQALLKTIRKAEHYASTKNPYDTLYGGGTAPITQMTVQEVIKMYDTKKLPARFGGGPANYGAGSGAAGAYQFMPFTLEDLIRRGAVKPNQIMTPELQDRLGWDLASNVRGLSVSGLKKSGLTQKYMDMIAPEWASFPYSPKGGRSYYNQPVKSSKFLGDIYQQSLPQKKMGGGSITPITTQTGYDIPGGKMGADTQYLPQYNAAVQPGEEIFKYVITKDAAEKGLGKELLAYANQRQAELDSNSTAANVVKNVKPNIPGPRMSSKSNKPIILPPIQQTIGSKGTPLEKNGSEVPDFPIVSPFSQRGKLFAEYNLLPSAVG